MLENVLEVDNQWYSVAHQYKWMMPEANRVLKSFLKDLNLSDDQISKVVASYEQLKKELEDQHATQAKLMVSDSCNQSYQQLIDNGMEYMNLCILMNKLHETLVKETSSYGGISLESLMLFCEILDFYDAQQPKKAKNFLINQPVASDSIIENNSFLGEKALVKSIENAMQAEPNLVALKMGFGKVFPTQISALIKEATSSQVALINDFLMDPNDWLIRQQLGRVDWFFDQRRQASYSGEIFIKARMDLLLHQTISYCRKMESSEYVCKINNINITYEHDKRWHSKNLSWINIFTNGFDYKKFFTNLLYQREDNKKVISQWLAGLHISAPEDTEHPMLNYFMNKNVKEHRKTEQNMYDFLLKLDTALHEEINVPLKKIQNLIATCPIVQTSNNLEHIESNFLKKIKAQQCISDKRWQGTDADKELMSQTMKQMLGPLFKKIEHGIELAPLSELIKVQTINQLLSPNAKIVNLGLLKVYTKPVSNSDEAVQEIKAMHKIHDFVNEIKPWMDGKEKKLLNFLQIDDYYAKQSRYPIEKIKFQDPNDQFNQNMLSQVSYAVLHPRLGYMGNKSFGQINQALMFPSEKQAIKSMKSAGYWYDRLDKAQSVIVKIHLAAFDFCNMHASNEIAKRMQSKMQEDKLIHLIQAQNNDNEQAQIPSDSKKFSL